MTNSDCRSEGRIELGTSERRSKPFSELADERVRFTTFEADCENMTANIELEWNSNDHKPTSFERVAGSNIREEEWSQARGNSEKGPIELKIAITGRKCLKCGRRYDPSQESCPRDGTALSSIMGDPFIGTTFAGRYKILELVGTGGASTVYKARDERTERLVALKRLQLQALAEHNGLHRLEQEVTVLQHLKHKNIAAIRDYGLVPQPFIVMDYVQGSSMSTILEEQSVLPIEAAISVFQQLCDALQEAHDNGIVHRDLKPANIILKGAGYNSYFVKVVDFGIAKLLEGPLSELTRTRDAVGSPLYMSPEQWSGDKVDHRSDIYSLGCVMYECLTGNKAFDGDNLLACMNKHLSKLPPRFAVRTRQEPTIRALQKVIFRALNKRPERRYQSLTELKKDLERIQAGNQQSSNRLSRLWMPNRPGIILALTAVLFMVAVFSAIRYWASGTAVGNGDIYAAKLEDRASGDDASQSEAPPGMFPTITIRSLNGTILFRDDCAFDLGEALNHAAKRKVSLAHADLRHADLTQAKIMSPLNLSFADLSDAALVQAELHNVDLHGASLSRSQLGQARLFKVNLRNAKMDSANLCQCQGASVDLSGADLSLSDLTQADLPHASCALTNFTKSKLGQANLQEADCTKANFRQADMTQTELNDANCTGTKFDNAELTDTNLGGAKLTNASFSFPSRCRIAQQ